MKKTCSTLTFLILVFGCSPNQSRQSPGKRGAANQSAQKPPTALTVNRMAGMPEPVVIVTSIPVTVVTGAAVGVSNVVSQQAVAASAANVQCSSLITATNAVDRSLVFDLSTIQLDTMSLQRQGIRLRELNDLRVLEFHTNSTSISLNVDNLPTGSMARTGLIVVRSQEMSPCILLKYGISRPLEDFNFCISQYVPNRYIFSAYAYDVSCEGEKDMWCVLCAAYDGKKIDYYVNGNRVETLEAVLNTPSSGIVIGSGFQGSIAEAKIWNKMLGEDQVIAESRKCLNLLE